MKVLIGIVIIAIVAGAAVFVLSGSDNTTPSETAQNPSATTSDDENPQPTQTYTLAEIAEHDNDSDCWMVIEDQVYDMTDYVARHPGGKNIVLGCGKDATSLFKERMTSDGESVGSGTPHSSSAESQLDDYLIGALAS